MPSQNDKITICLPTRGLMYSEMWESLLDAVCYFNILHPSAMVHYVFQHYTKLPDCRTEAIKKAIGLGATHIFFVDDDMKLPIHALAQLYGRDVDIVTALCWNKSREDKSKPMIGFLDPWFPIVRWTDRWYWPHFFEIHGAGLACTLIKADVFRAIGDKWFDFNWTQEIKRPNGNTVKHTTPLGEDLYFYQEARKFGYRAWCDSGVIVKHMLFSHSVDGAGLAGYEDTSYHVEYFPLNEELELYRIGNPERLVTIDAMTPEEYWRPHLEARELWLVTK